MSKTDKTRPAWVRLLEAGAEEDPSYTYKGQKTFNNIPRDFKWNNDERNGGPKYIKWAKRYRSKKNRKRQNPTTQMRGIGWGDENYRLRD